MNYIKKLITSELTKSYRVSCPDIQKNAKEKKNCDKV